MLIESKIKIGYDSMFNVPQTYFKSAHLLNKMALVQFQCSRTVSIKTIIKSMIMIISLICQLGDLLISYYKRKAKIKNTGNLIPGHGGLLDRIDGSIFALPIGFIIISLL